MTDTDSRQGKHDEFVKRCFEDLEIARAFCRHYLPKDFISQLDLNGIALEHGSYVDEEFRQSFSDLSYKVPLREKLPTGGPAGAYIYVLVEHKSEPDLFSVFQLLRYMVRIWQRELEAANYRVAFRFPPIVPLILHHGRTPFRAPVELRELVAAVPGMEAFVPNYRCVLVDLSAVPAAELPTSDNRLYAILSVMRSVFGREIDGALRDLVIRLAAFADRKEVRDTLEAVLNYALQSAAHLTNEGFMAAVEPLRETRGDVVSTLIQKWLEEGRELGIEIGRQEGRLEGRLEDRCNSIMDILVARFDSVPEDLREALRTISDSERLVRLTATAATCESVEQFVENLK